MLVSQTAFPGAGESTLNALCFISHLCVVVAAAAPLQVGTIPVVHEAGADIDGE